MAARFMRYWHWWPALLLLAAGGVAAAAFELSADAMREIEDTVRDLDSDLSLKQARAEAEALSLQRFFQQVEAHYAARDGDAARGVAFARESRQHAEGVAQAVRSGDYDAAQDALTQLTRSCKRCHDVYKKKD